MVIKVLSWFTPVRIALAGTVIGALLLVAPISFRAPGDHEMTNCGSTLTFDSQGYAKASERHYWDDFVHKCVIGRTTRLAQTLGVLAVTGVLVTFVMTRPSNRRATVAADDA
jgi:hypothetical protein